MKFVMIKQRIDELVKQHGGLRPMCRALCLDPGYLSRLRRGEKLAAGDELLRRLELRRVIKYVRVKP